MTINLTKSEPPFAPAMPMKTIEGPAAWRGVDIRNPDDFTYRLTSAEVASWTLPYKLF
jgi:hypothetical protein